MRRLFVALTSTVSVLAFTHMASAADLRVVTKAPPPLPPPVQDWSGIYVGLEGGYGWGKQDFNTAFDPFFFAKAPPGVSPSAIFDSTIDSVSQSGWLFGGFVGAQKQWGSWVLGIEADFDGADIKGSSNVSSSQCFNRVGTLCGGIAPVAPAAAPTAVIVNQNASINSEIDELGSVRGKVGWAFSPNWMIYGTGGLAWAHQEANASQTQTVQTCITTCKPFSGGDFDFSRTQSGGLTTFGWAAGAGIDWKYEIDPGSAVVLGVKYLHYGFGNNTLTLADNQFGSGASFGINTKESVDVVTGRISYLFSIH
jgi:outer membrane immunogenic protein